MQAYIFFSILHPIDDSEILRRLDRRRRTEMCTSAAENSQRAREKERTTWTINCVALNSYKQVMCANGHEFVFDFSIAGASLLSQNVLVVSAINLGIQHLCRRCPGSISIMPCNWRLCFTLSVIYIFFFLRSASDCMRVVRTHTTNNNMAIIFIYAIHCQNLCLASAYKRQNGS